MGGDRTVSAPPRRMLTAEQAADYCGFSSVNGFRAHVRIAPVKFGTLVRYDRADLDAYLDRLSHSRTVSSFSEMVGNEGQGRGR